MAEMLLHTLFKFVDLVNQNFFEFLRFDCVVLLVLTVSHAGSRVSFRALNRIYCVRLSSLGSGYCKRLPKVLTGSRHLHRGAPGLGAFQAGDAFLKRFNSTRDGVEFVLLGRRSVFQNVRLALTLLKSHDYFLVY